MGVCSSKEKKTKSETSSNGSAKSGQEKAAKKGKKGKEPKGKDGEGDAISLKSAGRKDSDIEDFKVPPQRGRSKSLRFGDFAQMDRIRRLDDAELLPIDIAFFQEGKVEPEELCHVCGVYTGSETMVCGVCYRAFHESCLAKIGQWSGPSDTGPGAGMWSCHQCANLGNLLTEEEIITVLKRLDKCGIRREDDLKLGDYMAYCHLSLQEDEGKILTRDKADNARRRFQQVDDSKRGCITWCQFLNIETIRFLKKRPKNNLVRLLTLPELERARDAFRLLDTDMDGRITKAVAHEALDRNSRRSGYYPDETMMYIDEDLDQTISWTEFLRDRAIYIIAERPSLRASPIDVSTRRRGSARSISHVTSLPVDPDAVAAAVPQASPAGSSHGGGRSVPGHLALSRQPSGERARSSGSTHASRTPPGSGHSSARSSGGGNRSGPSTPVSKSSQGFPNLPPPPYCSRSSSSSTRKATSVPSTPEKKFPPDVFSPSSSPASTQHSGHSHADGSRSSTHSTGSGAMRHSGSSESSWNTAHSGSSGRKEPVPANDPPRREGVRRSSQGDSVGVTGSPTSMGHVTGKPPIGNVNSGDGRHGRAVVAPPYGKLVERLQTGEWRRIQSRSMVLPSDTLQFQMAPSFGTVTGDVSTGKRPLSLV